MTGVGKRFGKVTALEDAWLRVREGALHAVVGENGAGKTTLMRVLYGGLVPDTGRVVVDGQDRTGWATAEAIAAGVGMVSQHYSIIPELTCLQNLVLGAEPGAFFDPAKARIRATELAGAMGFRFDWDGPAAELSPAGAQKLEILKLLWRRVRIMILDEPTAMLSPADSDALFESLRQLAQSGATVILVTHRLPEVMQHCEHVTVLRGGRVVADLPVSESNTDMLTELIVGHPLRPPSVREPPRESSPMLEVDGLTAKGRRGEVALKQISFNVCAGEVVGIAGVDGSGQRELFQVLAGLLRPLEGVVRLAGRDLQGTSPADRIRSGIRLIPEDRHTEGIVDDWSLVENAALGLHRLPPLAKGPLIDLPGRRAQAEAIAQRFQTRHGGLHLPIRSLSGGNQQRFVAARSLALQPKLILAFQPTRGLDIDGARNVYDAIRRECSLGAAALIVSFDLDELLEHCDRVLAMNGGRLAAPSQMDRNEIGRLMVGAA